MIHARVQHTPSRADLIAPLLEQLAPLQTEIIEHASEPPSPWGGYRLCLDDPPDCTHLLILQDDAEPAANFAAAVQQIADVNPDTPVCLFLARLPRDASSQAERAMKQDRRYVTLSWRSFLPIVAVLWPLAKAVEFRDWADEHADRLPGIRGEPRSDDAVAGRWKMVTRQTVRACVPSIVEHPDMVPSTIGRRAQWGQDRNRCAAFLADDALAFDWSAE